MGMSSDDLPGAGGAPTEGVQPEGQQPEPAGQPEAGQGVTGAPQPGAPAGRMYDGQTVSRIVQRELSKAEQRWMSEKQQLEAELQQYMQVLQQLQQGGQSGAGSEEYTLEDLKAEMELEFELRDLRQKLPGFAEHEDEIIEIAVEHGGIPLEAAYKLWRYPQFEDLKLEDIKKQAVAEYLAQKRGQAGSTPPVQGAGGGTPPTGKKISTMEDAAKAMKERLARSEK